MDNETIRGNNFIMTEPGLNDPDQGISKTKDSGTNSTAPDSAVSDPLISDSVDENPEIKTNTDKPLVLKVDVPTSLYEWVFDSFGIGTLTPKTDDETFIFDLR